MILDHNHLFRLLIPILIFTLFSISPSTGVETDALSCSNMINTSHATTKRNIYHIQSVTTPPDVLVLARIACQLEIRMKHTQMCSNTMPHGLQKWHCHWLYYINFGRPPLCYTVIIWRESVPIRLWSNIWTAPMCGFNIIMFCMKDI